MTRLSSSYQLLVVPLLVEVGFQDQVDRVLVVDCPAEVQRQRLIARDSETGESADLMIGAQADRHDRLSEADDTITTIGDLATTRQQVEALHNTYRELAASA